MAVQADLVIQGDDESNELTVEVVTDENGDRSVYNVIHGGGGNDVLSGRALTDGNILAGFDVQLFGEDGDDTIFDSSRADMLSGGGGDDTIYRFGGRDTIDGGEGFDTLIFERSYPTLNGFDIAGIEQLLLPSVVSVGNFDLNTVAVIGPDSKLYSRQLTFSKRADVTEVLFTGAHKWSLVCSGSDDVIDVSTSSVNFYLSGKFGEDTLTGGSGNDQLSGFTGNDSLAGGKGNDSLFGGNGHDVLSGGDGNDRIFTSTGDDVVDGGRGDDVISGAIGDSPGWETREKDFKIINGGAGDDVIRDFRLYDETESHFLGGQGRDKIVLGLDISKLTLKDIEILRVSTGANWIAADADVLDNFEKIIGIQRAHFEVILSSGGHFTWDAASEEPHTGTIVGSHQADYIDMSAGRSVWTVWGGDGNDTLKAGAGYTGLSGQAGRDSFLFDDQTGRTEIIDYDSSGADRDVIDLSAVSAIKDFQDMMGHHVKMTDEGDWLTIQFGKGDIELYHVSTKDLDAQGFVFG